MDQEKLSRANAIKRCGDSLQERLEQTISSYKDANAQDLGAMGKRFMLDCSLLSKPVQAEIYRLAVADLKVQIEENEKLFAQL